LCKEESPELGMEVNIPGNTEVKNTEDKFLVILTVQNNFITPRTPYIHICNTILSSQWHKY